MNGALCGPWAPGGCSAPPAPAQVRPFLPHPRGAAGAHAQGAPAVASSGPGPVRGRERRIPCGAWRASGGVCSLFLRLTKRWPFSACHSAQELPTGVSASSIPRHSAIRAPRSDANPVQQPAVLCCKEGPTVPQISPNTTSLTRNPFLINQEESTSPHPPPTPATLILPQRKLQGRCPSGGHTQPLPRCPSPALCQWGSEL